MTSSEYALYRYFDIKDRVLYVGKSGVLAKRSSSHIRASVWMQFAVRSTIERHGSLEELGDAERKAIEAEHPLFNKQYNDTPEARERLSAYLREIGRTDLDRPYQPLPAMPPMVDDPAPESPMPAPLTDFAILRRTVAALNGLIMATIHVTDRQNEIISRLERLERRIDTLGSQAPAYEQLTLELADVREMSDPAVSVDSWSPR